MKINKEILHRAKELLSESKKELDYTSILERLEVAKQRSNDPDTRVGAITLNSDGNIVGIGWNYNYGDSFSRPEKYETTIHAEQMALLSSSAKVETLITTHYPCQNCVLSSIFKNIRRIIYLNVNPRWQQEELKAACLAGQNGIEIVSLRRNCLFEKIFGLSVV